MFAARTRWDQSPNRLTEAWNRRLAAGLPAADLTESNPTRCGFSYPEAEIRQALSDPRSLRYEPTPAGLPHARSAVAEHLTRRKASARSSASPDVSVDPSVIPFPGVIPVDPPLVASSDVGPVDPSSILLTASTSEAYAWLLKLLCERGDNVLVPRPSYPLLDFLAELEDVSLRRYSLRYEGRWRIDLDSLESTIDARTRAVIVVHPNNPTGSLLSRSEADGLRRICAERDLALISDEVFLDYTTVAAGSLATDSPCLTFALDGLSKAAGLPQIKIGWIRVAGPPHLTREALARCEIIADTYLSVNTPAQWALPELLRAGAAVRHEIRERTRANRAWLEAREARAPAAWSLLASDGGWSAVLRVPAVRSEEEWCLRLVDDGILLHPGYFFDFETEAFLVTSLLPEEAVFRDAMERAVRTIETES